MTNATLSKFGYPSSLVGQTEHWTVLLRPEQPTLGSLVLICREPVTAFGAVSGAAFSDLAAAVARIETMLGRFVQYEKINYLMLMMVDPDVHFHVIPRYQGSRSAAGLTVEDRGWPAAPSLGGAATPDAAQQAAMATALRALWEAPSA
jgi:diadenosine tetraphosphate (Ap4A) HIT family hydrolase